MKKIFIILLALMSFTAHSMNEHINSELLHQPLHGYLDSRLRTWLCNMMYRQRNAPLAPICILECPARITKTILTSSKGIAVTASEDNNIRIWDLTKGTCIHTLVGHTAPIVDVKIIEPAHCIVTISEDYTTRIWDLASGTCLHVLAGHAAPIIGLALTLDGRSAITWASDHTARIWDIAAGTCRCTIECAQDILQAELTPDSTTAIIRAGTFVEIHDGKTGELNYSLPAAFRFYLSPDGTKIVTQWREGTNAEVTICNLWDVATGNRVKCLMVSEARAATHMVGPQLYLTLCNVRLVKTVHFSPDGDTLLMVIMVDNSDYIKMIDLKSDTDDDITEGSYNLASIALCADHEHIVGSSHENAVYLWDLRTRKVLTVNYADPALSIDDTMKMKEPHWRDILHPFTRYPTMVALSNCANTAVTTSPERAHVWNIPSGTLRYILPNLFSALPNSQRKSNNSSNQSGIMASLWHYSASWFKKQKDYSHMAVNPDGSTLASITNDGYNVKVWNITKETPEAALDSLSVFQIALVSEVFQRMQLSGQRLLLRPESDNHAAYKALPFIIKRAIQPYIGIYNPLVKQQTIMKSNH